ncbi:MAG: DegQ family serine endoprotease [Porticoccaceae bacterium]
MVRRWWLLVFFLAAQAGSALADLPDFTQLIAENSPAVVKITTVASASSLRRQQSPEQQLPESFREFFGQRQMPDRKSYGMGSGFIISVDGYILTNNHVVNGASEITVRLSDRREFQGKVIGVDPRSDLALLKVDANRLPVARFAAPGTLNVGEWVVAIGSPFGLDYSASAGIVSAIGRSIPTERGEDYVPFIQTDVAINPGNSGGPLFNLKGEVVGINSQIYTRSGGSIGLSFAIPVSVANDVIEQLKRKGRVDRGWLGVYIQDIDLNLAKSLGLAKAQGALIAQVEDNSPAQRAGIKPGDVVIALNGEPIEDASDLPHKVGLFAPGNKVSATLMRKGQERTVSIEIGLRPNADNEETVAAASDADEGDRLGLVVAELDEQTRPNRDIPGGVVVRGVTTESPAEGAGLRPGDIIVQLGYRTLSNLEDYQAEVKSLPKNTPIALRFFRRGKSVFRTIELD